MNKFSVIVFLAAVVGLSSALTHSHALSRLTNAGITVSSSGGCSNRNNGQCTSLEDIREGTISGLITLKNASGCTIVVTGGTEVAFYRPVTKTGHGRRTGYSHWNGYKADIRRNSCITNYITSRFSSAGTRSDGARLYRAASGNLYADEGNHWDIVYY